MSARVVVENLLTGEPYRDEGDPGRVLDGLLRAFPFLGPRLRPADPEVELHEAVEMLNAQQLLQASVDLGPATQVLQMAERAEIAGAALDQLGGRDTLGRTVRGACWLAARPLPDATALRRATVEHEGDLQAIALASVGLEINEDNRTALKAVLELSSLDKAEKTASFSTVTAAYPEGELAVQGVTRAMKNGTLVGVELDGKHSAGSLIAHDPGGYSLLLKPGAGAPSPAAGVRQEEGSQSRRETAFYWVGVLWDLAHYLPRVDLLLLDGREYAAIEVLGPDYENMQDARQRDPSLPRRALSRYCQTGTLHRWAILDYVLGNPDRHANNLMVSQDGGVRLIDHGSAFAGAAFDPAFDKSSFVPYYLRAWTSEDFDRLPLARREAVMPRVAAPQASALGAWLVGRSADRLAAQIHRFGLDPSACAERLSVVQDAAREAPTDLAINRLWIGT